MAKRVFTAREIIIGVLFIVVDIAGYLGLALELMNYEDSYDQSKGGYWSLESMTSSEKTTYLILIAWYVINVLIVSYLIYRYIKSVQKLNAHLGNRS